MVQLVFFLGVVVLGMLFWVLRYRKLYVEHILLALHDAASIGVLAYALLMAGMFASTLAVDEVTYSSPIYFFLFSLVKGGFFTLLYIWLQKRGLGHLAKAFAKNEMVYSGKLVWGLLLIAATLIPMSCFS